MTCCTECVIPASAGNDEELGREGIPRPSFYLFALTGVIGLCGGARMPRRSSTT